MKVNNSSGKKTLMSNKKISFPFKTFHNSIYILLKNQYIYFETNLYFHKVYGFKIAQYMPKDMCTEDCIQLLSCSLN